MDFFGWLSNILFRSLAPDLIGLGNESFDRYQAISKTSWVPSHDRYSFENLRPEEVNRKFGFHFTLYEAEYAICYLNLISRMKHLNSKIDIAKRDRDNVTTRIQGIITTIAAPAGIEPTLESLNSQINLFDQETRGKIRALNTINAHALQCKTELDQVEVEGKQTVINSCGLAEMYRRKLPQPEMVEKAIEDFFHNSMAFAIYIPK